jgi:hypothetical protein
MLTLIKRPRRAKRNVLVRKASKLVKAAALRIAVRGKTLKELALILRVAVAYLSERRGGEFSQYGITWNDVVRRVLSVLETA